MSSLIDGSVNVFVVCFTFPMLHRIKIPTDREKQTISEMKSIIWTKRFVIVCFIFSKGNPNGLFGN